MALRFPRSGRGPEVRAMQQTCTWCRGEGQPGPQAYLEGLGKLSTVVIAAHKSTTTVAGGKKHLTCWRSGHG